MKQMVLRLNEKAKRVSACTSFVTSLPQALQPVHLFIMQSSDHSANVRRVKCLCGFFVEQHSKILLLTTFSAVFRIVFDYSVNNPKIPK